MFEDRTQENLKAEALAAIGPETGISTQEGSFADAVVGAVAMQVSQLYQALPAVVSMLFVDETSGGFLDLVGETYFAITRRPGTKAGCTVTLTGDKGTVIPAGTVFLTAAGLQFYLTGQVTLPAEGIAQGALEAAEEGSAYNIGAGALTGMYVNIPGLAAYENQQASGGTDVESDQQLYARIDEARKRQAVSGNGWDYRRWALEVEGVGQAKVVELADGPGTVGLTVVDSTYAPASADMVEAVREHVMASKPIGAAPTVSAATAQEITVSAVVALSGSSLDEVKQQLAERLQAYFAGLVETKYGRIYYGPEEDLPYLVVYNRILAALLTLDGVENFSALTVNGGTADVSIAANGVPVLGEVVVTL